MNDLSTLSDVELVDAFALTTSATIYRNDLRTELLRRLTDRQAPTGYLAIARSHDTNACRSLGHCPDETPTSGGVELTDAVVQALADEAERGYDPDTLIPRPVTQEGCYALTSAGRGLECGVHGKGCDFVRPDPSGQLRPTAFDPGYECPAHGAHPHERPGPFPAQKCLDCPECAIREVERKVAENPGPIVRDPEPSGQWPPPPRDW